MLTGIMVRATGMFLVARIMMPVSIMMQELVMGGAKHIQCSWGMIM